MKKPHVLCIALMYPVSIYINIVLGLLAIAANSEQALSTNVHAWSTSRGNVQLTRFFPTEKPLHAAGQITVRDITLPYEFFAAYMLAGDVDGTGTTKLVGMAKDPLGLVVVDPLTGASQHISLEPNPYSLGADKDVPLVVQLVDYDSVPGLEAVCWLGHSTSNNPEGLPVVHEIVSIRDQTTLVRFYGYPQDDINGDGFANGTDGSAFFFRDASGKGKLVTAISMNRPDLQPRELRIYDTDTGVISSRFQMAAPFGGSALKTLESGETYIFSTSWTPDNGVTGVIDGIPMTDSESYLTCLKYGDSSQEESPLSLQWHRKRGELMGGDGLITRDSTGRLLAVAKEDYIRAWDPFSAGGLHVMDLITGELVAEFFLESGLSFTNFACAPDGTGIIYTALQEKAAIAKFDISRTVSENPVAYRDFTDVDISGLAFPLCATDMNGDGSHDLVIVRTVSGVSEVVLLDSDLNDMAIIDAPLNYYPAFADADNDGYPEMYICDPHDANKVRIIEYAAEASTANGFEAYP